MHMYTRGPPDMHMYNMCMCMHVHVHVMFVLWQQLVGITLGGGWGHEELPV